MKDSIFNIQIIKNNSEYEDVSFKSDLLSLNYTFSSAYYIQHQDMQHMLKLPDTSHPAESKRIVFKHLLSLMLGKLSLMKRDHSLFLPIDMAEDYTGVLKCSMDDDEEFFIQFGVVDKEDIGIDIKTLEPIGNLNKHFTAQTALVACQKEDLLAVLAENLLAINTESVKFITQAGQAI